MASPDFSLLPPSTPDFEEIINKKFSLIHPDSLPEASYGEEENTPDTLTYSISSEENNSSFNITDVTSFETKNIIPGEFKYIKSDSDRFMFQTAWKAINQLELWDFVKQEIESFALSNDPRIKLIIKKIEELGYQGHSGISFGYTMREMQYVAIYGERNYS
jgi:hypothetical protein